MHLHDYERVDSVLRQVLDAPEPDRPRLIDRLCGSDDDLRSAVLELLEADRLSSFLETEALDAWREQHWSAAADPEPLSAGDLVGHHRIVRLLGTGGMGHVYLAEDLRLHRQVALKVLSIGANLKHGNRRLREEARLASRLDHPGICTIYEAGEAEGLPYIAMKYVEGETIRDRLQRLGQPFSVDESCRVIVSVAEALAVAHSADIVHGDITAGNVMLEAGGGVTVLDFGIARHLEVPGELGPVAPGSMVRGTASYMSPEQIGGEAVDARADVFSVCVLFYEMLTGSLPFNGDNRLATLHAIRNADHQSATSLNPAVPAALSDLVDRGLAKQAADRPPTMAALIEALAEVRSGERRLWKSRHVIYSATVVAVLATGWFQFFAVSDPAEGAGPEPVGLRTPGNVVAPPRSGAGSATPPDRAATLDPQANQYYLLGRYHAEQGSHESFPLAIDYFKQAVAADPDFAVAWAALSTAYLAYARSGLTPDESLFQFAAEAAEHSLQLNPALGEPHISLGLIAEGREWDWAAADRHYRLAVEVAPNDAQVHRYRARFLAAMGEPDGAVAEAERAIELSPASLTAISTYAFVLFMADRHEAAIEQAGIALEMNPEFGEGHFVLGMARYGLGDYEGAIESFAAANRLTGRYAGPLGLACAAAGYPERTRELLVQLETSDMRSRIPPIEFAMLQLALGERDAAFASLERMVTERNWNVHILKAAPQLDPLRGDPRFAKLLIQVGFANS